MTPTAVPKLLLTVPEAAAALSVGRTKIYELVDAGALRSVHVGRARRIPVAALAEYVASLWRDQLEPPA